MHVAPNGHVTLLGMMTAFDERLGVNRSIYHWGHEYKDHLATASSTAFRLASTDSRPYICHRNMTVRRSSTCSESCGIFRRTVLVRVYGSVLGTLDDLPFEVGAYL